MEKGGRFNAPGRPLWIDIISEKLLRIDVKDRWWLSTSIRWIFSLKRLHDLKGKNIWVRVCQKSLPNLVGASVVLGQSANGRAPFWGSQWLARIRHCVPAPMEKGHFSGIICRRCLQGTWSTYSGEHNASVFRLCHCSQVPECILQCTKTGVTGTVTNGDKLLCNRCPLKHEARERERGEMLYKNTYSCRRESALRDTIDSSNTWCTWYGLSHP
jgi:hypothetical protein